MRPERSRSPRRGAVRIDYTVPLARTPQQFRTYATELLSIPEHAEQNSRVIGTLVDYYVEHGPQSFMWSGDILIGDEDMARRWLHSRPTRVSSFVYDVTRHNLYGPLRYDRSSYTGLDLQVQRSVALSPGFITALTNILDHLRIHNVPSSEAIYIHCRHGVHRSVAIACILQNLFLRRARLVFHNPRVGRALDDD